MLRKLLIATLVAMAGMFSGTAFAQGTAAEAKAMLEKALTVEDEADSAAELIRFCAFLRIACYVNFAFW